MEDAFAIKGGKKLSGEIKLSGAKNVASKVIIASLLFDEEVLLENIPRISDVEELLHLIKSLGGKAEFVSENSVIVDGRGIKQNRVDLLHAAKIRVSFMLFAPLLYKFNHCFLPNPGGCRIGARPIDRIIDGMKSLGVTVEYDSTTGYYEASMANQPSGHFKFVKPSHTGTELLILLSLFAKSSIIIENAALEPEIDDLIKFLNSSGAKISRDQTNISIQPVEKLKYQSPFSIMADRNEAGTFVSLTLATGGSLVLTNTASLHLTAFVNKLRQANVTVEQIENNSMRFYSNSKLKSTNVETSPHPGFMTDWQPNWAVLMTQAHGESLIYERVFENRFSFVDELRRLGAEIDFVKPPIKNPAEYFFFNFDPNKKYNQVIRIKGPQKLHGGVLDISDLRSGATLAEAALIAEGESIVNGASQIERGYENFVGKIKSLGGEIRKI